MIRLHIYDYFIPCRTVIFDKDGTLVDFHCVLESLFRARLDALIKALGPQVKDDFARNCGYNLHSGEIDPEGPLATAAKIEEETLCAGFIYQKGYPFPQAREIAARVFKEAEESLDIGVNLKPLSHAGETLRSLREQGFRVVLATGDGHDRAQRMMELLGWLPYFDLIIGVDEVGHPKPSPDMIFKCSQALNIPPEEMVVVGDSCLDSQMGKSAGVKATIGVATGPSTREKLESCFDIVIPDLSEIKVG